MRSGSGHVTTRTNTCGFATITTPLQRIHLNLKYFKQSITVTYSWQIGISPRKRLPEYQILFLPGALSARACRPIIFLYRGRSI